MARDRRHAKAEFAKGGWQNPPTYATAYDTLNRNRQFQELKRNTKVALRGIHVACLLIMFQFGRLAMPYSRRDDARHATLLFCAFGGWVLVLAKAQENRWRHLRGNGSTEQQFAINKEGLFFMKQSSANTTVVLVVAMMLIMMVNLIISVHLAIKCKRIEDDSDYEISEIADKFFRLETSMSKLKSHVSDIESEIDDMMSNVNKAKSNVGDLGSRLGSLELTSMRSAFGKSDLESRISAVESSVSVLKISVSDIELNVSNLRREFDTKNLHRTSMFNLSTSY